MSRPTIIEIKKAVRARDRNRCTRCGKSARQNIAETGRTIHVHRLVPGSRYTVDGCISVCMSCHWDTHGSDSFHLIPSLPGERRSVMTGTSLSPSVRKRVDRLRRRLGMNISGFVRVAVEEKLLREEATRSIMRAP